MKVKITPEEVIEEQEESTVSINVVKDGDVEIETQPEEPVIKIEIVDDVEKIRFELNVKSAVNGDLMIFAHRDIDIVLNQKDKKILAFAKEINNDFVYGAESRLFEFLRKMGLVNYDSIQGGNIYGSMEGTLMDAEEHDVNKICLLAISQWMETEEPYINDLNDYDQELEKHELSPDGEYSTELGEVPAEDQKGSIIQRNLFAPYLYGRYTY